MRLLLVLALLASACAHTLVITSDPPGLPVRIDGRQIGQTPVEFEEEQPFRAYRIEVGEGPEAVTRVVRADQTLSRDGLSALLMPLSCLCGFPLLWTAGTPDRLHVVRTFSGQSLAVRKPEWQFESEYLPENRVYPAGIRVDSVWVGAQRRRVMTDRRPWVLSLQYLGIVLPSARSRIAHAGQDLPVKTPLQSFGFEQEYAFAERWGVGASIQYASFGGTITGTVVRSARANEPVQLRFREWRWGGFVRYRHPWLHWDGVTGGLDTALTAGVEGAYQRFRAEGPIRRTIADLYLEAALDVQITQPLVVFVSDRFYPLAHPGPGRWKGFFPGPAQRVMLGGRLFY